MQGSKCAAVYSVHVLYVYVYYFFVLLQMLYFKAIGCKDRGAHIRKMFRSAMHPFLLSQCNLRKRFKNSPKEAFAELTLCSVMVCEYFSICEVSMGVLLLFIFFCSCPPKRPPQRRASGYREPHGGSAPGVPQMGWGLQEARARGCRSKFFLTFHYLNQYRSWKLGNKL